MTIKESTLNMSFGIAAFGIMFSLLGLDMNLKIAWNAIILWKFILVISIATVGAVIGIFIGQSDEEIQIEGEMKKAIFLPEESITLLTIHHEGQEETWALKGNCMAIFSEVLEGQPVRIVIKRNVLIYLLMMDANLNPIKQWGEEHDWEEFPT